VHRTCFLLTHNNALTRTGLVQIWGCPTSCPDAVRRTRRAVRDQGQGCNDPQTSGARIACRLLVLARLAPQLPARTLETAARQTPHTDSQRVSEGMLRRDHPLSEPLRSSGKRSAAAADLSAHHRLKHFHQHSITLNTLTTSKPADCNRYSSPDRECISHTSRTVNTVGSRRMDCMVSNSLKDVSW
jgi:hypothetical protein